MYDDDDDDTNSDDYTETTNSSSSSSSSEESGCSIKKARKSKCITGAVIPEQYKFAFTGNSLSNPLNRIEYSTSTSTSASSSFEEPPTTPLACAQCGGKKKRPQEDSVVITTSCAACGNKMHATTLACPYCGGKKKKTEETVVVAADIACSVCGGHNKKKSEEEVEVVVVDVDDEEPLVYTTTKLVHMQTVMKEVKMGKLETFSSGVSAPNTTSSINDDCVPLTSLSTEELAQLKKQQETRFNSSIKTRKMVLEKISSLSLKDQQALALSQIKKEPLRDVATLSPQQQAQLKNKVRAGQLNCNNPHHKHRYDGEEEEEEEKEEEDYYDYKTHRPMQRFVTVSANAKPMQTLAPREVKLEVKKIHPLGQWGALVGGLLIGGIAGGLIGHYYPHSYAYYRPSYYGPAPYYYYYANVTQGSLARRQAMMSKHTLAATASHLKTDSPKLVNVNHLPLAQQAVIVSENKKKIFDNKSMIYRKKAFDMSHSFNASLKSKPMAHLLNNDGGHHHHNHHHYEDRLCGNALLNYMTKNHPLYTKMLERQAVKRQFHSLIENVDSNYWIIVPPQSLIRHCLKHEDRRFGQLCGAYFIVLTKESDGVPDDASLYSCATLLEKARILVRRLDDETLEIDNLFMAKREPASRGRVYTMLEPNGERTISEIITEEEDKLQAEMVGDEEEAEEEAETGGDEEEEEEETTTQVVVEPEGEKVETLLEEAADALLVAAEKIQQQRNTLLTLEPPRLITRLPKERSVALVPLKIEEELLTPEEEEEEVEGEEERPRTVVTTTTTTTESPLMLRGVYKNMKFKNTKVDALTSKMLRPSYNGCLDMGSFLENKQSTSPVAEKLYFKIYSYENLFKKYEETKLAVREQLHQEGHFVLKSQSNAYNLDKEMKVKEFVLDESQKITKSQLINHLAVLSFLAEEKKYAVALFSLPDDSSKTNTYMSSDENVFLTFKENTLHSVSVNMNSKKFLSVDAPIAFTKNRSTVMSHLSAQVNFRAPLFSKLYTTELSRSEFMNAVLPLSQASFIRRARVLTGGLFEKVFDLHKTNEVIDLAAYSEIREATVRVSAGIAAGVVELTSNILSYTAYRVLYLRKEREHEYLYAYEFEPAVNKTPLSFLGLRGDKGKSKILSIRLYNPHTDKDQTFKFRLSTTRNIATNRMYLANLPDLDVFFQLDQGNVDKIYVRFVTKKSSYQLDSSLTLNADVASSSSKNGFEVEMAKFLGDEAYWYKKMNLTTVDNTYLARRTKVLISTNDKKQASFAFFQKLREATDNYMTQENLKSMVSTEKKVVNEQELKLLVAQSYVYPHQTLSTSYKRLLTEAFDKTKTTYNAQTVLTNAVNHYVSLSGGKDKDFVGYMDRFRTVVDCIVSSLQ
jgi:hypothetical protein